MSARCQASPEPPSTTSARAQTRSASREQHLALWIGFEAHVAAADSLRSWAPEQPSGPFEASMMPISSHLGTPIHTTHSLTAACRKVTRKVFQRKWAFLPLSPTRILPSASHGFLLPDTLFWRVELPRATVGSREKRRGHGGFASEVTDVTATLGKVTDESKRRVPPAPYSDPTGAADPQNP